MKAKTNWYWKPKNHQHVVIVSTPTIVHPCLDVSLVKDVARIPRSFYNISQAREALPRFPTCITDTYHDYILDKITRICQIEFKRQIEIDN